MGFIGAAIGVVITAIILHEIIEHAVWRGTRRALREHREWLTLHGNGDRNNSQS